MSTIFTSQDSAISGSVSQISTPPSSSVSTNLRLDGSQESTTSRNQQAFTSFDIRNFADQLEPAKEKNKYICPVCGGHNLSIKQENGKYSCFNGCERRDIREEIKPWSEVKAEREGNNYTTSPKAKIPNPKPSKPKPILIPEDEELILLMLTELATDIPQPQKLTSRPPKEVKGSATETIYPYSDTQWVTRYEWEDASKEKGYSKTFRQWHRREDGTPEMRKGDALWVAYRIEEAIAAAKSVNGTTALLQLEGEKCVEIARSIGICAITFQGSSWNKKSIVLDYKRAKQSGIRVIIFLHDNDDTGIKKAAACAECAAEVGIGFIAISPLSICPDLQSKGDIEQILAQMEVPEFIRKLEEQIHAAVKERSQQLANLEHLLDIADDSRYPQDPILNFNQKAFEVLFGDKNWICADDRLYYHTGNHYKHSPDSTERPRITNFCNSYAVTDEKGKITHPYANPSSVKKVLEWAKLRVEIDPELINPPGVNCLNGVVRPVWEGNKVSVRLDPHTPQDYFIYEPLISGYTKIFIHFMK